MVLKTGAMVAALAATGWATSNAWIAHVERLYTYANAATVPARTFAIVPGSPVSRTRPSPVLRDRLEAALELYREGRVKAILVSGREVPLHPEATVMRTYLQARGVPADDIWSDGGGTRTRTTMNRAVTLYGVTDAIICTQTVNMARSLYLAHQAGIDAVGLALATTLERSPRYMARESLKTTLAFAESQLQIPPTPAAPVVAVR